VETLFVKGVDPLSSLLGALSQSGIGPEEAFILAAVK